MPTVGDKQFPYTSEGLDAAERYAAETGMEVEYEEGREEEIGQTAMYKKIQNTGSPLYKMKGHTLPGIKQK